ncbi:histidine phosphatase family protein [Streptomyces sp. NA04227]|uniref:histidine phosphatase family protein n=1 Tax=Streptomyces sp. NA04227 TaxID=2742136 RepID=UPI0015926914|nr:histidine phosphatase family protein [Streptomyces sp. NA04227]QKW10071.1 histidine phosphatase family protein [Streptomyces sp. NA04227]
MGDLLLVRHGETEWSRTGQHTSWTDLALTENGRAQARAVGPLITSRRIAAVLCSPRLRARETAELAGLGEPILDEDLTEWDYGAYEGITTAEIHTTRPGWFLFRDGVPEGPPEHPGETPEQVGLRADRVLARADAMLSETEGDVVLVAHGHLLRVLTARRLGLPPAAGGLFQLATATLGRLGTERGRPVVAEWNLRPGL